MGNSETKEIQVQSQPTLPVYLQRELELRESTPTKANLTKKDIVDSMLEKIRKCNEEKKESGHKQHKKVEPRVKKAKGMFKIDKENEPETEDIEPVTLKLKDSAQKSHKKQETVEQ